MTYLFTVVDIESTGLDPENDAIVEIGCVDVENGVISEKPRSSLVKPPIPIPPQSSAVHHLIDADVVNAPPAREIVERMLFTVRSKPVIYVAHKADFEQSFLKHYLPDAPWICTYKAALRIWPTAPAHSNQVLRYWRGLNVDRSIANFAHRALPDALVTAHLLLDLLNYASAADMLAWTLEPPYMPVCPIGAEQGWKGKPWSEIEMDALFWITKQKNMNPDIIWNANHEMMERDRKRREHNEAAYHAECAAYVAAAKRVIVSRNSTGNWNIKNEDQLKAWFKGEAEERTKWGIDKGTAEYAEIAKACAEHKAMILAVENKEAA